jgi:predicted GIY-YIG superfamily endonuclease
MTAKRWCVYILRCHDGTLYTGIAVDLPSRNDAHRRGAGAKYTRSRLPVALAYLESHPDRSAALKREAALRRLGRAGKLALIALRDVAVDTGGSAEEP